MPNHFASIGFLLASEEDASDIAQQAVEEGDALSFSDGTLLHWSTESGAELWLPLDRDGYIQGMEPHYAGDARMRVRLTAPVVSGSSSESLLGGFYAWGDPYPPEEATPDAPGLFPFVFAAPDYPIHRSQPLPYDADVQLVGFAHELTVYPDESAYDEAQTGTVRYAAESFIPSGLFTGDGDAGGLQPFAIASGFVLDAELRINEDGGGNFYALRIRTLGGEMNVVAEPDLITTDLLPGAVVSGTFYLSGRLSPAAD